MEMISLVPQISHSGGLFFIKPIRGKNYVTIMDPFQEKYGKTLTSILFIPSLLADIFWVACVLAALGEKTGSFNPFQWCNKIHHLYPSSVTIVNITNCGLQPCASMAS